MTEFRGWVGSAALIWRDTREDAQADIDLYHGTEETSIEERVTDSDA